MPDSVSNSDIDAILRRQISSVAAQEKCERNDPNEISAYLEGALSSKRVADFEQHLINCGICRRAVVELHALDEEIDQPVAEVKTDSTVAGIPAIGVVERLRKLLFGPGNNGYMWRPAAALIIILLMVGAPAILFLRQGRQANDTTMPVGKNKSESATADKPAESSVGYDNDSNGLIAQKQTPSAGKTVEPAGPRQPGDEQRKRDVSGEPAGAGGQTAAAGPPAASPAAPPPPPPAVVASADKDVSPPKAAEEKKLRDQEFDKVQRQAENATASNVGYGATLTWNVTVTMTPVDSRAFVGGALNAPRTDANSPDRGGARGQQTEQQPASAKSAPGAKNEDRETASRTDDAKRKEVLAKKPAVSAVPYDKRVGQILKARFDKYMEDKVRSGTGVTIRFRVGSDGTVISLKDGKVPDGDIIKRSSNDVINMAVMKAIGEGKLPAFGENEKDYSQIILVIKFEPTVN